LKKWLISINMSRKRCVLLLPFAELTLSGWLTQQVGLMTAGGQGQQQQQQQMAEAEGERELKEGEAPKK